MSNTAWIKAIDNVKCASQGSIYSDPIPVENLEQFGLKCLIESGTGDVSVSYEVIESNKTLSVDVTAEVTAGKLSWIAPVDRPDLLANATNAAPKANGFSPMVTKWLRFKVTGNAGNGADCYVSLKMSLFHRA